MTNEVKNVPKLRFQRFEDEWKKKRLKDIVEPLKGNSGENKNLPVLTISAKKGWLNQKERFSQVIAGNSLSKYNELKKGDLSYNKGNSKVALYGIVYKLGFDNALVPNVYKSFRPKPNNVSDFLEKYFHTKILDRQLRRVITSTARMDGLLNISDYDFYNMSLNIPDNNEQKKIGDFFSKLDQQIELEEQKLAKLEEQKKGYMQNLFSQELRFKDENGNDYPEWETKKLDELGEFNSGVGFPEKYQGGSIGVPFFKVSDMNLQGNEKFMNTANNYVSIEQVKQRKWKVIQNVPAIIFAKVGAAIMLNRKRMILNPFLIDNNTMSYSFSNHLDKNFGYAVFQMLNLPKYAQVGALPSYNSKDIGIIQIRLPIKEEQEKIGDFFSELDKIINKQSHKIDALKLRKKGFLQKMFV